MQPTGLTLFLLSSDGTMDPGLAQSLAQPRLVNVERIFLPEQGSFGPIEDTLKRIYPEASFQRHHALRFPGTGLFAHQRQLLFSQSLVSILELPGGKAAMYQLSQRFGAFFRDSLDRMSEPLDKPILGGRNQQTTLVIIPGLLAACLFRDLFTDNHTARGAKVDNDTMETKVLETDFTVGTTIELRAFRDEDGQLITGVEVFNILR